jgi:hypothetical protein
MENDNVSCCPSVYVYSGGRVTTSLQPLACALDLCEVDSRRFGRSRVSCFQDLYAAACHVEGWLSGLEVRQIIYNVSLDDTQC